MIIKNVFSESEAEEKNKKTILHKKALREIF